MRCVTLAVGVMILAAGLLAAQADPIPAHDTFTIVSSALREPRLVNVHTPVSYAREPDARFAVLYMPDGGLDEDFPHVVHTVDSLVALGRIPPFIVVGIPNTERRRDLTGPTRVHDDSAIAPHVGGSAAFRRFIAGELIPAIDARYRTTARRAIVGESLAGLFIVETFLRRPELFDRYVAFDPSLWWNRGSLVDSARALLAQFRGRQPRRLFLASSDAVKFDNGPPRFAAVLARDVIVPGLAWIYLPRPDLTHATIFRGTAPAALAWALAADSAAPKE